MYHRSGQFHFRIHIVFRLLFGVLTMAAFNLWADDITIEGWTHQRDGKIELGVNPHMINTPVQLGYASQYYEEPAFDTLVVSYSIKESVTSEKFIKIQWSLKRCISSLEERLSTFQLGENKGTHIYMQFFKECLIDENIAELIDYKMQIIDYEVPTK